MATKIRLAEIAWERRLEDISLKEDWEMVLSLECVFFFIDRLVHAQMSPRTSLTRPHDDTPTQHRHTHRVGALITSYPEDKITPVGPSRTPTVHRSPEGEAVGGSTAHTCHMHDTGVQHTFTTLLISTRRRHENGWKKSQLSPFATDQSSVFRMYAT